MKKKQMIEKYMEVFRHPESELAEDEGSISNVFNTKDLGCSPDLTGIKMTKRNNRHSRSNRESGFTKGVDPEIHEGSIPHNDFGFS